MELRNYIIGDSSKQPNNSKTTIKQLENIKNEKPDNIHKNHRARLKNQYVANGIESLTDIQKLELLLFYAIPQKDTNPLSHKLISTFGSLKDVFNADYNDLIKIDGVKENTATLLTLVNGILNHCNQPESLGFIGSTEQAKSYCSKFYFNVNVEQFYVFCLSKSNQVKRYALLKTGTSDEVNVQIREITQTALDAKCNRIIVCHNHPKGRGQMSDEDCAFTYSLMCSCLLNSIDLLDHIIVGTDRTISLSEQQITQRLKARAIKQVQVSEERLKILSAASEPYIICPEPKYD